MVQACDDKILGKRVLQLRINNKLTSVVAIFKNLKLQFEMPEGYPQPAIRVCYLYPIDKNVIQVLYKFCKNPATN